MITTIDLHWLGQPGTIAAFLVEGPSGVVLVETGPASCLDALQAGLAERGIVPGDISDVLVTHIHFDHAGAAWWLAGHGATIHVHTVGARHLADPERLVASAARIYGARMEAMWGAIEPVPADRINALADGAVIQSAGLRFEVLETLGHARHHHAFILDSPDGRIGFVGDAAGMIGRPSGAVLLPTPPPDLDVDDWHRSIGRLRDARLDRIWLTHFGPVDDPAAVLDQAEDALRSDIDLLGGLLERGEDDPAMREAYRRHLVERLRSAGASDVEVRRRVGDGHLDMNLAGVRRWFERRRATGAT